MSSSWSKWTPLNLAGFFEKQPSDVVFKTEEISIKVKLAPSTIRSAVRYYPKNYAIMNGKFYWGSAKAIKTFKTTHKLK